MRKQATYFITKDLDEMHPHVHKRIGLAIAAIIVFAALCCGVMAKRNTIIAYADRHILLENTNSGYCKRHLSSFLD